MYKPKIGDRIYSLKDETTFLSKGKSYVIFKLNPNPRLVAITGNNGTAQWVDLSDFRHDKELHSEVDYLNAFQENFREGF